MRNAETLSPALDRAKLAAASKPAAGRELTLGSRHVPAAVRRAVRARDEGRCAFVGTKGRCAERGLLEVHHVVPYAAGAEATIDTIAPRCRAHNQHEAELDFGRVRVRIRGMTPWRGGQETRNSVRTELSGFCARVVTVVVRAGVTIPSVAAVVSGTRK